jgi:hypothetical protein
MAKALLEHGGNSRAALYKGDIRKLEREAGADSARSAGNQQYAFPKDRND